MVKYVGFILITENQPEASTDFSRCREVAPHTNLVGKYGFTDYHANLGLAHELTIIILHTCTSYVCSSTPYTLLCLTVSYKLAHI